MSNLPEALHPMVSIAVEVIGRRIPGAHVSDVLDAADDMVEKLWRAGWLNVHAPQQPDPAVLQVIGGEASPDMDSGGAG